MKLFTYLLIILHENMLVFICATLDENYLCSRMPTVSSNSNCGNVNGTYTCYGSIPAELPSNVTRVALDCIDPMLITNETFRGGGWGNLTYIRLFWKSHTTNNLSGGIFTGLKRLTALHINILSLKTLDKGVFDGLENVTILNLDDCWKLNFNDFLDVMSNEDVLPNLHSLSLRKTSSENNYGAILGERFWKMFQRPLLSLDISQMKVNAYDMRILEADQSLCRRLELLNMSSISISNHQNCFKSKTRSLQNLKVLDFSALYIDGYGIDAPFFV
ncbi:hypothetical protein DPMN_093103 [Dreissena polymorpha]|uniref:Uncharacterized protein n=1 Tax=Dreissena polymorpha TaxID=45954 RepID=A0A9D4R1H3_DREPO|nr:hypothetical protein DPMN_093103 [Dreissena polymorpha]